MPTIGEALAAARRTVDAVDARVLLCHAVGRNAAYLAAHADSPLTPEQCSAYEMYLSRRAAGEPVAYLIGRREFYGLEFRITPAVMIPRPETELLVDLALARIPQAEKWRVLDLGTGSGCIALSIAHARPRCRIVATDNAPEALALARENAQTLHIGNVDFAEGTWFAPVARQRFDLIVSNPPYVAAHDPHLAQGDLRYEPRGALIGGSDGLDVVRAIVAGAPDHLRPRAALLFEHGYDQGTACRSLLETAGFCEVRSWRDLGGRDRVSGGVA
jgi:release factor glutamine methyltransferase